MCPMSVQHLMALEVKPDDADVAVEQDKRFSRAVLDLEVNIAELVTSIVDVRAAQATVEADLIMIQNKIEVDIGHNSFDKLLRTKLMAYLVHCVVHTKELEALTDLESALMSECPSDGWVLSEQWV